MVVELSGATAGAGNRMNIHTKPLTFARICIACLGVGFLVTTSIAWSSARYSTLVQQGRPTVWSPPEGGIVFGVVVFRGMAGVRVRWGLEHFMYDGPTLPPDMMSESLRAYGNQSLDAMRLDGSFPLWWGPSPSLRVPMVPDEGPRVIQDARGWPLPAFRCEWNRSYVTSRNTSGLHGGLPLSSQGVVIDGRPAALPFIPIAFGLICDTICFATPCFMLCLWFRLSRRTVSSRCGLCPLCGYPTQGITATQCPECGGLIGTLHCSPTTNVRLSRRVVCPCLRWCGKIRLALRLALHGYGSSSAVEL